MLEDALGNAREGEPEEAQEIAGDSTNKTIAAVAKSGEVEDILREEPSFKKHTWQCPAEAEDGRYIAEHNRHEGSGLLEKTVRGRSFRSGEREAQGASSHKGEAAARHQTFEAV